MSNVTHVKECERETRSPVLSWPGPPGKTGEPGLYLPSLHRTGVQLPLASQMTQWISPQSLPPVFSLLVEEVDESTTLSSYCIVVRGLCTKQADTDSQPCVPTSPKNISHALWRCTVLLTSVPLLLSLSHPHLSWILIQTVVQAARVQCTLKSTSPSSLNLHPCDLSENWPGSRVWEVDCSNVIKRYTLTVCMCVCASKMTCFKGLYQEAVVYSIVVAAGGRLLTNTQPHCTPPNHIRTDNRHLPPGLQGLL